MIHPAAVPIFRDSSPRGVQYSQAANLIRRELPLLFPVSRACPDNGHEKSTETTMMKSLFAGATALALIAGAAVAQQSYDSSTTRTTTVTAPVPVAPPETTTTTVQRTVQPQVIVPPAASTYREEHVTTENGQTVEHTVRSNTETPYGSRTTTYSQTTTKSDGDQ
jgi:uncharacterized membrane protein YcgQ (UPF0703/DUF1980 family)